MIYHTNGGREEKFSQGRVDRCTMDLVHITLHLPPLSIHLTKGALIIMGVSGVY